MTKDQAAQKVKLLLALATSPNENEAASAKSLADKLIAKFDLLPKEIEADNKAVYTDDDLLFEELILTDWRPIIALAASNKYGCMVIREDCTATTLNGSTTTYRYYVYGDEADVARTRLLFEFVISEIDALVEKNTAGKSNFYTQSYAEGAATGIQDNILYEDFATPAIVKAPAPKAETPKAAIVKTDTGIAPPPQIEKRTTINKQGRPIDTIAFVRGEYDGSRVHLDNSDDIPGLEVKPGLMKRVGGFFGAAMDRLLSD